MQTHSHVHDHAFTEASMCPRCTHMHVRTPASTMRAHLPTFACTGHTLCSHMYACTHIHTCAVTHTYCVLTGRDSCARFICVRTSIQHTGVPVHMCTHVPTHTPMRWHTCAHPHMHTCLWPRSPSQLQVGCISGAPAWAALPGVGLASTSPPRPLREPVCPCLPWTWASIAGPSPDWQLCPLYPEHSPLPPKHEAQIPPREACPLSPAGGEPPSLGSCVPLRDKTSSALTSAMGSCGQAPSLSLCLGGGLPHSSRWKHVGGWVVRRAW